MSVLGHVIGNVARRQSLSSRSFVRNVSSFSALALTSGLVVWKQSQPSTTSLEEMHLNFPETSSLVIPTLEASVRALRLVRTAVMIVLDYEISKRKPDWLNHRQNDSQIWEKERETRQQDLKQAQSLYTHESNQLNPSTSEYRQLKQQQKQAVHEAAEKIAEADVELALLGGNEAHRRAANRLLQLCRENGGVYIKIGQHLANLDYILPAEYIEVLSTLLDAAPLTAYSDVCRVIQEELGKHPDELFVSFEKEPIASASLAQVHVAFDRETGKKLAVKVQHRGLRETSAGDVFALTAVVGVLDALLTDFTWGWLADEIAPQLPKELDFYNEGKNSEKAAAAIETSRLACIVPKVIWEYTSSRVLCMDFEEGFKATDLDAIEQAGLHKRDIAKLISSVFNDQIFSSAFVHCDPHPANVLIRARNGKPEMVLIDHGLYKQLDDEFRIQYANLWRSLMMADLVGIKESCKSLGVDEMYTLFAAMLTSRPYDEIMERAKTGSLAAQFKANSTADRAMIQGYAQHFLSDIFAILGKLPRQMLLLLKMNDCLRHIDYILGSPTNTLVVAGKYASKAVFEDQLKKAGHSIVGRFKAWMDYARVILRIQIHDVGVWWTETAQTSRFRLLSENYKDGSL